MFRNQYDTDVTVWSPQGHLYQVDYAMEAVKQGSACLGLRSDKVVVLGALKRSANELSEHQKKIFSIDRHMGIAIAGLTSDARSLARYHIDSLPPVLLSLTESLIALLGSCERNA